MKKLWDTKAFSAGESNSRKSKALALFSTHFLTILLSVFLLIVVSILFIVLWTSNGTDKRQEATQVFYDPSKSSSQVAGAETNEEGEATSTSATIPADLPNAVTAAAASAETAAAETAVAEETYEEAAAVASNGGTLTVYADEGAGSIAARAGISIEELYALNPDKMTGPGGTWWANPGDVVVVN